MPRLPPITMVIGAKLPKPPPRAEARDGAFPTITMVIGGKLPPRPSPSHLDGGGLLGEGYYQTITMVIGAKLPKPSPRAEARATSLGDTSFL